MPPAQQKARCGMDIANRRFTRDGNRGRAEGVVLLRDRFEIGDRLAGATDGYGTSYRAEVLEATAAPRRTVALVVLRRRVGADPELLATLSREFAKLRALEHPNIERLLELNCDGDACYYTSEFIDGEPLRAVLEHLKPERLEAGEADAVLRTVGSALAHAHAAGVAHGNVRAEHVLVTMDHDFVLTGFLARRLAKGRARAPTAGADVRALALLALELYTGSREVEALERLNGLPRERSKAIRAALMARGSRAEPTVAEFLATAGLVSESEEYEDDHEEASSWVVPEVTSVVDVPRYRAEQSIEPPPWRAPLRRAAPKPKRRSLWLRLGAVTALATMAAIGLVVYLDQQDPDWRVSLAELESSSREALRAATARLAAGPDTESGAVAPAPITTADPPGDTGLIAGNEPALEPAPSSAPPEPTAPVEPSPPAPEPAGATQPTLVDAAPAPAPSSAHAPPEPAVLSLDVPSIAAGENHTAVAIDVVRRGDASSRAAATWWTTPATATADDDYASFGTTMLEFAPGETVRRVLIPLVDDGIREPDETFVVHLAPRPRGALPGPVMTTRVTVYDDD